MALDWANERFVRFYTRETPDQAAWCWQARAIWPWLIARVDGAGVIETRGAKGLAAAVRLPLEVVEAGIAELIEDGCVVATPRGYAIRNYIEAQTTQSSQNRRQAAVRERDRALAALTAAAATVTAATEVSHAVTPSHAESRAVTPCHSDPSQAEPNLSLSGPAGARDPGAPAPEHERQMATGTLPTATPVSADADGRGRDQFVQLAADARSRVTNALHALMGELGKPMFPAGQHARRLSELELEQLSVRAVAGWAMSEPDRDPAAVVGARVEHLIAVRSAVARERRNVSWWAQATFWNPDHLERDLLQTPDDAVRALRASSRGRDGGPGGPRASPRTDRGQAPPASHHGTGDFFDDDGR